ncbi:hypothetical protein Vretifemale_1886 [Volvox reticuliferus]|nr:hypothetical protein Vretifemale_1886 [Volvox reticuliferus]
MSRPASGSRKGIGGPKVKPKCFICNKATTYETLFCGMTSCEATLHKYVSAEDQDAYMTIRQSIVENASMKEVDDFNIESVRELVKQSQQAEAEAAKKKAMELRAKMIAASTAKLSAAVDSPEAKAARERLEVEAKKNAATRRAMADANAAVVTFVSSQPAEEDCLLENPVFEPSLPIAVAKPPRTVKPKKKKQDSEDEEEGSSSEEEGKGKEEGKGEQGAEGKGKEAVAAPSVPTPVVTPPKKVVVKKPQEEKKGEEKKGEVPSKVAAIEAMQAMQLGGGAAPMEL